MLHYALEPGKTVTKKLIIKKNKINVNYLSFSFSLSLYIYIFLFLLSSMYIRRKYWIRENFRLPVFDGFTCFEMSRTQFDNFYKYVCLSVCLYVCLENCEHCISKT